MSDKITPPISAREKQDRQVREGEVNREKEQRDWIEAEKRAKELGIPFG